MEFFILRHHLQMRYYDLWLDLKLFNLILLKVPLQFCIHAYIQINSQLISLCQFVPAFQIIRKRGAKIPIVVCCNKIDLPCELRQCRTEIKEAIVRFEWECGFIECSAKNNVNILSVFKELLVQANVRYNLSPAVRRRRKSLPSFSTTPASKFSLKRHSCSVS